jgi:acyl-CoA synthetase (AMP-forming)/AMP-acid ligase II
VDLDVTYPGTHAEADPDRAALVMATAGTVVTYGELDARSNRLARLLRRSGLGRGDHIAVFLENHPRYLEVVWAGLRSGLHVTPVNSHLTAAEAGYIIADCGARALVTSRTLADVALAVEPSVLAAVPIRLMIDGTADGFAGYEDAIASESGRCLDDEVGGAYMFYSSGTTGRPKGVLRPLPATGPRAWEPRVARLADVYGYRAGMRYLSPAPTYHAAPLGSCINVQRFGGTVVMMEHFDAAHALRLIDELRITHSQWVPTMFIRMLRLPDHERLGPDLSSHEVAVHAAAPCPVDVKRQMIEWWGPILYEYYSGTELAGMTAITSEQWLAHPGSVGRPLQGEVKVLADDGRELPRGQVGLVYFSGGPEFEYHGDPAKTAESKRPGGLTTFGDLGYVDDDGWLFLTDRKAFMIIAGGVNIYPQEIEDVLLLHPAVDDVAVFGVPNSDLGEEVKAVVQPASGVDATPELATELIAFARARLAAFKCPRSVDFEAELPRLPTGKLYKRLLRDRYWAVTAAPTS